MFLSVGRDPVTKPLHLDNANVNIDTSGKIVIDDHERTNINNIYAIGDVALVCLIWSLINSFFY